MIQYRGEVFKNEQYNYYEGNGQVEDLRGFIDSWTERTVCGTY